MSSEIKRVTREELFELVWTIPMRELAPQFGLTNVGLAKVCDRHDIPRPPIGYWAKQRVGKAFPRPELATGGDRPPQESIEFSIPPEGNEKRRDEFDDEVLRLLDHHSARSKSPLGDPGPIHKLVANTKAYRIALIKRSALDRPGHWSREPWPERKQILDMDVTKVMLDRAYEFLDLFIKECEARGFQVQIDDRESRNGATVKVLTERYSFRIRERLRKATPEEIEKANQTDRKFGELRHGHLVPRGELEFFLRHVNMWTSETWQDTQTAKLGKFIHSVFYWLICETGNRRKQAAENHRRQLAAMELERKRAEEEKRRREEQQRRDILIRECELWHTSNRLREYLSALRAKLAPETNDTPDRKRLADWFAWASQVADDIDPTIAVIDEVRDT